MVGGFMGMDANWFMSLIDAILNRAEPTIVR